MVLTDQELRIMRQRADGARTAPERLQDVQEPLKTALLTTVARYAEDVPPLLDEIERLADEVHHWRKRATFAEQFIPSTP